MIPVKFTTGIREFRGEKWPAFLSFSPQINHHVLSQGGVEAQICKVTHRYDKSGPVEIAYVEVELTKPGIHLNGVSAELPA